MDFSKKIILLIILFTVTAMLSSYLSISQIKVEGETIYPQGHLTIPGWQVKEIPSPKFVMDELKADLTVFADYFHSKSALINLYIGYYDSLEKSTLSHAPQVCYTAQGWIMENNDKIKLELTDKAISVNRLILDKDGNRTLVYYWYQAGGDIYSDLYRMKLKLAIQKIFGAGNDTYGNAFVRISTPISKSDDDAHKQLQEFSHSLLPALKSIFVKQFSK